MKKLFLIFSVLLTTVTCMADGHLMFKGNEIDGNISSFCQKLINQGYRKVYTTDEGDACMLKGSFAGFDDCQIAVLSTQDNHIVWKVVVYLPEQTSWYSLKSRFNDFKTSLTDKYGTPRNDYHYFTDPYYEGDGYELQALSKEKCTYYVTYEVTGGIVALDMQSAGYGKGEILIKYEDAANLLLQQSSKKKSVADDL